MMHTLALITLALLLPSALASPPSPPSPPPSPPPPSPPPSPSPPPPLIPCQFTSKDQLKAALKEFNENQILAEATHGRIADWDVKCISDMSFLFSPRDFRRPGQESFKTFDANISYWDTSGVTDMSYMFSVRSARAPWTQQPPVLVPTLKRAARAAAASHALPPPDPHLSPHHCPSL